MIHISGGMAWQKVLRFSLCVRIICCIPGKANKTVHSIFKSSVPGKWSVYEYFRGRARPCGPELVGGTCFHIRRDSFVAEGYYDCWAGDMF